MGLRNMRRVGSAGITVQIEIPLHHHSVEPTQIQRDVWVNAASNTLMIFRDRERRGDTNFRFFLSVERVFDSHEESPTKLGKVKSGWSLVVRGCLFVPEDQVDGHLDDLIDLLMSNEELPTTDEAFGTVGGACSQFVPDSNAS